MAGTMGGISSVGNPGTTGGRLSGAGGTGNARGTSGGGIKSGGGGNGSRPSKQAGMRASDFISVRKPQLTVFEKASRGLPLDDDELAQLSPEQRAYWESQRASAMLGVA